MLVRLSLGLSERLLRRLRGRGKGGELLTEGARGLLVALGRAGGLGRMSQGGGGGCLGGHRGDP